MKRQMPTWVWTSTWTSASFSFRRQTRRSGPPPHWVVLSQAMNEALPLAPPGLADTIFSGAATRKRAGAPRATAERHCTRGGGLRGLGEGTRRWHVCHAPIGPCKRPQAARAVCAARRAVRAGVKRRAWQIWASTGVTGAQGQVTGSQGQTGQAGPNGQTRARFKLPAV
jgi:hypothetical protein